MADLPWGLLIFLGGLIYGWWTPGTQNKTNMLKMGLLIGAVVGVLFAVLGYTTSTSPLGFANDVAGTIVSIVILTILFIAGVWVGDFIEARTTTKRGGV
ncbi:MAG: hypothetical protein HY556_00835 [Euryarchaeota archaeon]|nr:hypothetical protein [Euryarchaeota archaeon]